MSPAPASPGQAEKHRTTFNAASTLWIVSHDDHASSWMVYRGLRTTTALERVLARERRAGRRACVELEMTAGSPVEMSLPDLVALGIVTEASS